MLACWLMATRDGRALPHISSTAERPACNPVETRATLEVWRRSCSTTHGSRKTPAAEADSALGFPTLCTPS